jgi:hypothetical protein
MNTYPPGSVWVVTSILPSPRGWCATLQVKTPDGKILTSISTYLTEPTREEAEAEAVVFISQNPDPNKLNL